MVRKVFGSQFGRRLAAFLVAGAVALAGIASLLVLMRVATGRAEPQTSTPTSTDPNRP